MDKLKEFLKSLPLPLRIIAVIAVGALILLGTLQGCALKFNASGSADNMSGNGSDFKNSFNLSIIISFFISSDT